MSVDQAPIPYEEQLKAASCDETVAQPPRHSAQACATLVPSLSPLSVSCGTAAVGIAPSSSISSSGRPSSVTFHALVVTPGLTTPPPPFDQAATRTPTSILKNTAARTPTAIVAVEATPKTYAVEQDTPPPRPQPPVPPLPPPCLTPAVEDDLVDLPCEPTAAVDYDGAAAALLTSSSAPFTCPLPSTFTALGASSCDASSVCSASYESIVEQYRPVYPTLRLIATQLQQPSLWDRLFTHCTGRDLLCKIVQHSCGLLRSLLQLWDWAFRRFVRYAAFRRMFCQGRDIKSILPPPAVVAPTAVVAVSSSSEVSADSEGPAPEEVEPWVPPFEAASPASLAYRFKHISYTMDRARQVLRFGRWIYDIPDVKDSALELWYGENVEKSMEEQEAEEEWEEHERLPVRVRSRRPSIDLGAPPTHQRESSQSGRGTFLFPTLSRPAPSSGATAAATLASNRSSPAMSLSHLSRAPDHFVRHESSSSIASTTSMGDDDSLLVGRGDDSPTSSQDESAVARGDGEEEEEEEEGMTALEWVVGIVDLANSLMGLAIDASDDVEFVSSCGLLSADVGEVAGTVSSYLWCISGVIDVAMCCYKLRAYRQEMRETLAEKIDEWREANAQHTLRCEEESRALADGACSSVMVRSACAPPAPSPRTRLYPTHVAPSGLAGVSLCTPECDVDCFHIEYLRLYRYIGELGLSVCGVLIGDDEERHHPLQTVLEASGLFSGIATFIKRGATHARSRKFSTKSKQADDAEYDHLQLYA